jgi:hypothetical protein
MKHKWMTLLSITGFATLVLGSPAALAQISLGTAQSFAVLAGQSVTNTGASTFNANVGVSPGTSITGFPPGVVAPPGMLHSADGVAAQAQTDLTAAYNAVAGTACNVDLTGQDLGGLTLTPGVYCFTSSAFLTGALTLDFQGNPNSIFLFKIGSTLITASGSSVLMINSGGANCAQNLFWQVGSDATLGTGSQVLGNILALSSITLTTGAQLSGRALARNGTVTLDTNSVTACGPLACPIVSVDPATLPNGVLAVPYSQVVSGSGGTAPYTFSLTSGALPSGLLLDGATGAITGTPLATGTSSFTITAADANDCLGSRPYTIAIAAVACPVITLSPSALPPGTIGIRYNQTVSASGGVAPYTFAVTSGSLPTGLTLNPATGVLTGVPTTTGFFSFTIGATDANGCPGSALSVSITIALAAAYSIPALELGGLAILMLLLAGAGMLSRYRSAG